MPGDLDLVELRLGVDWSGGFVSPVQGAAHDLRSASSWALFTGLAM
jgi:hypothetical protein